MMQTHPPLRAAQAAPSRPSALRMHPCARARRLSGVALLLFGALALLAGCGGDDDGGTAPAIRHAEDFLPAQISGWDPSGDPATGTTEAELAATVINGASNTYARHGMKEFAMADYIGSGAQAGGTMKIWIFEMTSPEGAQALYDDEDLQVVVEDTPEIGEAARISPVQSAGKKLEFLRDGYYVKVEVAGLSSPEASRNQAEFFAGNIDQEMTE